MYKRYDMKNESRTARIVARTIFGRILSVSVYEIDRENIAIKKRHFHGFRRSESFLLEMNNILENYAYLPEAKPWPWPPPTEKDLPHS